MSIPDPASSPSSLPALQAGDEFVRSGLSAALEAYLEPEQIAAVRHPRAVARILADMRMNAECIQAAILHDVIEDTATAKEEIKAQFGAEVAEMVDGVSKLTQIRFETRMEEQAENFRKMLLAPVQDIRVVIIKLADR
ncbi:MAG: HD domain-containing protein, partial [Gammaproteobacteria bacterium]